MWQDAKVFFESHGITGGLLLIILFLLYIIFVKTDNVKTIAGWIYQLIAFPLKGFRKKAVKYKVEAPCTKALRKIASELPDIEIPDLNINWVNEDNLNTILKSGKAIVKLKYENDHTKNIVKATSLYVKEAFLNHTKPYLNIPLKKAIDVSVTKKILLKISKNQGNIMSTFIDESSTSEEELLEKYEQIEEIDDSGLLTRILLRELDLFGKKLHGRIPKNEYKDEADEFLGFVNKISTRDYDDDTPLAFSSKILKVSVVLVAKVETYTKYGLNAYLRRIKLGLSKGIESFYLLARTDSVPILKEVAKQLLNTGNFILINKPKEFIDLQDRIAICYCVRINDDSILANTLKDIGIAIENKTPISGVIQHVGENYLKIDVNGIEGYLRKENLSVIDIVDARKYFKENSFIDAIPLEIQDNGIVEYSLRNTKSDPNHILTSQFEIGKRISGKFSFIEDTFVTIDLGLDKVEGFSFRKDLTYSRFEFLHTLFKIGEEYEFNVLGYNFEKGNIRLKLADLKDPWQNIFYQKNSSIEMTVCKKTKLSFVGEISPGVEAVLPFKELAWFDNIIKQKKSEIRLNSKVECYINNVDKDSRVVFVTLKSKNKNPFIAFANENKSKTFEMIITEINSFGIIGYLANDNSFTIYVPSYETTWNGTNNTYHKGRKYDVQIIGVDKYDSKLLGTFKPFIKHPLSNFESSFGVGQVLKKLTIMDSQKWGLFYKIQHKKTEYKALLHRSEIADGFIENCESLKDVLNSIPLCISNIDKEKNQILLSLKDLTNKNSDRINDFKYEDVYDGHIIAKDRRNYIVLIKGAWVVGYLETENRYELGDFVEVRPTASNGELVLTDE